MNDIVLTASEYARFHHKEQMRKYNTGEQYFVHLEEVAKLVKWATANDEMTAAAYLHDIVEDQGVPLNNIRMLFGEKVAQYVDELTDVSKPEDGNRKKRKEIDRQHIAKASPEAKSIKCADLISNTKSIVEHAPKFAPVYLEEKRLLLEVLTEAEPVLFQMATAAYNAAMIELKEGKTEDEY